MTSTPEEVNTRLERIRTLLHRLARVRDAKLEADLITELTLETEAVRKVRANAHATPEPASTSRSNGSNSGIKIDFARASVTRAAVRARAGRRAARG